MPADDETNRILNIYKPPSSFSHESGRAHAKKRLVENHAGDLRERDGVQLGRRTNFFDGLHPQSLAGHSFDRSSRRESSSATTIYGELLFS